MTESILKYEIIRWGAANKIDIKPLKQIQKRLFKFIYKFFISH